ncbi:MAG TPA: serine/threonine-protein kinase, partial [Haliangium sp.]|nr:serine/threonine-protein kinase [Haliangium sp.]
MPSFRQAERTAFGKYTLIARLATGGMGEIFLARLQGVAGFEKIVVIKRVLPHLAGEDRFIAMLLDEARIAARLSHPNICQVQELGEVEGEYYIAMEYLEGVTMADLLRRLSKQGQVMDPRVVVAMVTQACEGLHAAHELVDRNGQPTNLVHRDVSPSNVFITTAGMVKLLDFGIAKTPDRLSRTRTGAVKGKWAYMSPEQIL